MSRGESSTPTPAQLVQAVEVLRNATVAEFVVAELAEHRDRVTAEANGSLLVRPRMSVVAQLIHQLCSVHGLEQPAPARTPGPPGDHAPGGPV